MLKGLDSLLNLPVSQPDPYSGASALRSQRHTVCLLIAVRCHSPIESEQYGGVEGSGATPGQHPLDRAKLGYIAGRIIIISEGSSEKQAIYSTPLNSAFIGQ